MSLGVSLSAEFNPYASKLTFCKVRNDFAGCHYYDVPEYTQNFDSYYGDELLEALEENYGWLKHRHNIQMVEFDESIADEEVETIAFWFYGCYNLRKILKGNYLNTDKLSNISSVFKGCKRLEDFSFLEY